MDGFWWIFEEMSAMKQGEDNLIFGGDQDHYLDQAILQRNFSSLVILSISKITDVLVW